LKANIRYKKQIQKLEGKDKEVHETLKHVQKQYVIKAKTDDCIGRYPDVSKRHVVLSYAEGTFGVNDLVKFNTILTRPPNPDALPQMCGRLARQGQKEDTLYLEYILLENTIEEA